MRNLLIIIAILISACFTDVNAQNNVRNLYDVADDFYNRGKIHEAEANMDTLFNDYSAQFNRLTKSRKAEIYRLSAKTNTLLRKTNKAQDDIKEMLAVDPYYIPGKFDLNEFNHLMMALRLKLKPKLMVGLTVGGNLSDVILIQNHTPFDFGDNQTLEKDYKVSTGFQIGLNADYALTKNISIALEPTYINKQFSYSTNITVNNEILPQTKFVQKLSYAEIPVLFRWQIMKLHLTSKKKKANEEYTKSAFANMLAPYVQAGVYGGYLVAAMKEVDGGSTPVKVEVNPYNYGLTAGGGLLWYLNKVAFAVDVQYRFDLNNTYQNDNRYLINGQSDIFQYKNYTLNDDIKLSNIHLTARAAFYLSYKVFE